MNSIIGYILSAIGLIIILGSEKISPIVSKFFEVKVAIIIILGIAFILAGIFILMNPSSKTQKIKHAKEEVPIYEGEGKNKRIVGYKKTN